MAVNVLIYGHLFSVFRCRCAAVVECPSPEVASYGLQSTQGEERLNDHEVCQRERNEPPYIVVFVCLHVK